MRVFILDYGSSSLDKILFWLIQRQDVDEVSLIKDKIEFIERVKCEIPDMAIIRIDNQTQGLAAGRVIDSLNITTKIVFISADPRYALDAYEVGAYGYLLSPVSKRAFQRLFK